MRPDILNPLFAHLTELKGVGSKLRERFADLAGSRVADLLWHFPRGLTDRSWRPKVAELVDGKIATLRLTVGKHKAPPRRGLPYRISASDETGKISLVFFNAREAYLREALPEGEERIVSGKAELYGNTYQMVHPDYILKLDEQASLPETEPLYPLTAGLTQRVVLKTVHKALTRLPNLPEWLDPSIKGDHGWPGWKKALEEAHAPKTNADLDANVPPRQRLAYDELLANELTLHLVRAAMRRKKGRAVTPQPGLKEKVLQALPFQLTREQKKALSDIEKDMAAPFAMLRLLQGDVGSGKTVVAFLAMLDAVGSKAQAAFLAPTEILSRQHFETLRPWADAAGVTLALLTGRDKGAAREKLLGGLANGQIQILVGTHALFQE
ncbi:MAG TPA: DEAD/DEAH box helicase, partial [Sphingomonadales bacterium]|nr:DEAD/DEAH box helicase [Sphingomonadales bacterium]